jgi:hypothetical protein
MTTLDLQNQVDLNYCRSQMPTFQIPGHDEEWLNTLAQYMKERESLNLQPDSPLDG